MERGSAQTGFPGRYRRDMGLGHSLAGIVEKGGGFPGLHPLGAESRGASAHEIGI